MSIMDLLKRAAIATIPIAIIALLVGAHYWNDGGQGRPNANTVLEKLAKENPGRRNWLVLFTDAPPTAPANALEAAEGHAWLAVLDTQTKSVTALGFYPKDPSSLNFSNPRGPGMFRDESKHRLTVAHAYEIDARDYAAWLQYLAAQMSSARTYHLASFNCCSWVIRSASAVVNPEDIATTNFKIADPQAILDENQDVNSWDARDLAVFLKQTHRIRSRVFIAGVNTD